jgi:hypothetical protein
MKAGMSGMPESIAASTVSCRHCRMNFAGIFIPAGKTETEAFKASEGLNASRIQLDACCSDLSGICR